jgi:L-alanine-DL-glutamate epimerase-like enolase superfamily enzyme
MKIDRLETINLRFEYEDGFTYAGGKCTARMTTLVLVHTDTGQVGVGSAYSHPGLLYLIIQQQLQPLLVGEDPTDVARLWKKMYQITRWYGRKGAAMSALGALDTAFWDLRGISLGKPVWELLGSERRSCPAYASALMWKDIEALAQEAALLVESGFRRVKMRLGRNQDYDVDAVRAVRDAIGGDCDLMVDASMRYDVETAKWIADSLVEGRVFWVEEPFEPEDIDSYVALRSTVSVPLAAGENEFGFQGFRELVRTRALDILQPDASRCGGLSEVKHVADLARSAKLGIATHSWSDAVAIVANAHVVASVPNGITVEVDQTGNPFVKDLLVEPLVVVDGELTLSAAPGLGIALDLDVIDRLRMKDPMKIPDGLYSDMVFGQQYYDPAGPYLRELGGPRR